MYVYRSVGMMYICMDAWHALRIIRNGWMSITICYCCVWVCIGITAHVCTYSLIVYSIWKFTTVPLSRCLFITDTPLRFGIMGNASITNCPTIIPSAYNTKLNYQNCHFRHARWLMSMKISRIVLPRATSLSNIPYIFGNDSVSLITILNGPIETIYSTI